MRHFTPNPTPLPRHLRWRMTKLALLCTSLSLYACGGSSNDEVASVQDSACAQVTDTGSVVVGSGLPGDPTAP
jgi:gamma-glutamyltranspeptidase / glutathione hydrolase